MNNSPVITGELLDIKDAVRRLPRYAWQLTNSAKSLSCCLSKAIAGFRWVPFRIISSSHLNELMIRADKVESDAQKIAEVGLFIVMDNPDIPNPWKVLDESRDI